MGVIRSGLLIFVGLILFVVLLAGGIILTLDLSLDYDNVKPQLVANVRDIASNEFDLPSLIDEKFPLMQTYCQNYSEYVFFEQGYTFVTPCSVIVQGTEAVVEHNINDFVEKVYYKDYDCGIWNCIKQGQVSVLVSQHLKDYLNSKFYLLLISSLVLIALMFLLVEHKPNLLIVVGGLMVVSSLPLKKLNAFLAVMTPKAIEPMLAIFITRTNLVFLIMLIIGIVLLGLGIAFRFLTLDFMKRKFSRKDVKEIVKKEVSSSKEETKNIKEKTKSKK